MDGFTEELLAGKLAITQWKTYDTDKIYSKVGVDLQNYNVKAKLAQLSELLRV